MAIKFGTSGWRGVMAENFTFPNLRICSQAISEEIFKKKEHNKPVVVGYDTRFLSEHFAREAATILANNGLEVRFSERDVPTPVVAHEIIRSEASGGLNITASHNPPFYNGLKVSSSTGAPALPETTQSIENLCSIIKENEVARRRKPEDAHVVEQLIHTEDFRASYVKHLKRLFDASVFRPRKLKVVVDAFYGTARGYLADILRDWGCEVEVIHDRREVLFGGGAPDPSAERLSELGELVKKRKAHLGLACDGDADRFGVVDNNGRVFSPNEVLALFAKYLHESRGWQGIIARSVMTTHAIDAVAHQYGFEIKETPVGFKHIGEIMREAESIMPSNGGEFIMGAEESGGFTMRGHVPEKDGILAGLLVAEMVASTRKSLTELQQDLFEETGVRLTRRINIQATAEIVSKLKEQFSYKPPIDIDGLHVRRIVDIDGFKFIFHGGSWLGVRFSGTEPIIRLYAEGDSEKQLDLLQTAGKSLIQPPKMRKK